MREGEGKGGREDGERGREGWREGVVSGEITSQEFKVYSEWKS